jgi:hypothetical protein
MCNNECDTVNLQTLLHRETVEMKVRNIHNDQQTRNIHSSVAIAEKEEGRQLV